MNVMMLLLINLTKNIFPMYTVKKKRFIFIEYAFFIGLD